MSLSSVASQLRASTAAASSGAGMAAQVAGSAGAVTGALSSGSGKLKGVFKSVAGEAQVRANLLTGKGTSRAASAIPSDGTRCEECGEGFGLLRRRSTCTSCDRYLCGACLGRNQMATMVGISCFCGSLCPRCRDGNARTGEFAMCRETMESGISVTLGLPGKAGGGGLFGGSGGSAPRKFPAWVSVEADRGELRWATLQQRQGRPAEEGHIPVSEVVAVRNTGVVLEVSTMTSTQPITMEFGCPEEREAWARYVDLAVQVLTPEEERAALDEARSRHRHSEVEERRALNEERKKQLQQGLGMRFTAEAMMARDEAKASAKRSAGAPAGKR